MDSNLKLKEVTIISINGRDPENSARAIDYSCKNIDFYDKIIFTNKDVSFNGIKTIKIENLSSIEDYNIFCIKELHKYIKSSHCLIVQPDGFVVNPYLWSDFYLQYDYIGAPWSHFLSGEVLKKCNLHSDKQINIVGNGGFSLRSKKLLKECSNLEYSNPSLEEDCFLTTLKRKELKEKGIKFAPVMLAQQFALESPVSDRSVMWNSFGFHGSIKYFPHFKQYFDLIS